MQPEFWHEVWQREGRPGFDQAEVNPGLKTWWSTLGIADGERVYVPLCGRSLDMVWLAERGHPVVGTELSQKAILSFFEGRSLTPTACEDGDHTWWAAGEYTLVEGDVFKLKNVSGIRAFYDRAAVIALPEDLRSRYVAHLAGVIAPGGIGLMQTMEYDPALHGGPPFSVSEGWVRQAFESTFRVEVLHREFRTLATHPEGTLGLPEMETVVWKLTRRG